MDVPGGVVIQTKVQKLMFERWGETLAMDFTHGTNNLGYHLEWRERMETYPEAKVVLCQFHVIAYWKTVMKRSTFRLTFSQRETSSY
ncbi:hypothetical protein PPTG_21772 [Phytophthora nicotianae INRA-310]|uniref:ZSWIM1/3 RNaseH-like domain-containing protein n=1 Tax=Phytophthora nicotianae (strain INRA-310) TaxID=761204 RepID=W2QUW9_PHYN3|nr:hypothetical protein PPTG_21772 [Phytophthora nicotianae INRA-310]ETN16741.1 hypothetical protein PPTG_21772 [Phytophthora nicotianae INRA-310]